jgi:general secretion pathway protein C
VKEDGVIIGWRLFGIRPQTLLGKLGLQNKDTIVSVNGFSLGDPQKALEAYARIRTAERVAVQIRRGGQDFGVEIKIE